MVFSNANYEKAFPRKETEKAAPVMKQHEQKPGNVLEEAEKIIKNEPENKPDPLPDVEDQEGGEDGGTE